MRESSGRYNRELKEELPSVLISLERLSVASQEETLLLGQSNTRANPIQFQFVNFPITKKEDYYIRVKHPISGKDIGPASHHRGHNYCFHVSIAQS